jgi:hypothetical protein
VKGEPGRLMGLAEEGKREGRPGKLPMASPSGIISGRDGIRSWNIPDQPRLDERGDILPSGFAHDPVGVALQFLEG